MGIWYEAMMRWVGPARRVTAAGRAVVPHRRDASGARAPMTIPDHVDIVGEMEQGGQMRFCVSTAIGHAPAIDVYLFGSEGTLRVTTGDVDGLALHGGRRGDKGLSPVAIAPEKRGAWRVEQEFVSAIRGLEPVTHTDLATGVRYMDFTDAVTRSLRTGKAVAVGF
jgi:predicted dehydrogenase